MIDRQGWGMPALVFPSYGHLHEDSGGTNLVMADNGTWYKWIASTVGFNKGTGFVLASATSDDLTIDVNGAGIYYVHLSVSFSGSNASNIHGGVAVDGTVDGTTEFHRKLGGADFGSASSAAFLDLAVGAVLDVRFSSDTDTTTVITEHVHFLINRISR